MPVIQVVYATRPRFSWNVAPVVALPTAPLVAPPVSCLLRQYLAGTGHRPRNPGMPAGQAGRAIQRTGGTSRPPHARGSGLSDGGRTVNDAGSGAR